MNILRTFNTLIGHIPHIRSSKWVKPGGQAGKSGKNPPKISYQAPSENDICIDLGILFRRWRFSGRCFVGKGLAARHYIFRPGFRFNNSFVKPIFSLCVIFYFTTILINHNVFLNRFVLCIFNHIKLLPTVFINTYMRSKIKAKHFPNISLFPRFLNNDHEEINLLEDFKGAHIIGEILIRILIF